MPYYPKSRIVENKNSDYGEFVLINGKEYIGPYYTTFNGKSFTGPNPNTPNSQLLISTQPPKDPNANPELPTSAVLEYNSFKTNPDLVDPTAALVNPPPFTPRPTEEDYKTGRITRYIARQKGGTQFKVLEINKTTYDNLTKQRDDLNYSVWRAIPIQWQISGPLNDELVNGIKVRPGIIDTNQKILDQAEKNFIGIKQYLSNLTQFAR